MNKPTIGQTFDVRGTLGTIVAVHAFGTIDVELPNGRTYRVTGLFFN